MLRGYRCVDSFSIQRGTLCGFCNGSGFFESGHSAARFFCSLVANLLQHTGVSNDGGVYERDYAEVSSGEALDRRGRAQDEREPRGRVLEGAEGNRGRSPRDLVRPGRHDRFGAAARQSVIGDSAVRARLLSPSDRRAEGRTHRYPRGGGSHHRSRLYLSDEHQVCGKSCSRAHAREWTLGASKTARAPSSTRTQSRAGTPPRLMMSYLTSSSCMRRSAAKSCSVILANSARY